jgi:hypothetical protein
MVDPLQEVLMTMLPSPRARQAGAPIPEPVAGCPKAVAAFFRARARARDRGAVTVEKAMLIAVVIVFGLFGIRFVGDPLRDPVFRVIFGILMRIYELIVTMLGGFR